MVRTQLLGRPRSQVSSPGSEDRSVVAARLHADVQPCRPRESWSYACTGGDRPGPGDRSIRPSSTRAPPCALAGLSLQGPPIPPRTPARPGAQLAVSRGQAGGLHIFPGRKKEEAAGGRSQQQDPGSIRNGPCPSTQSGSSADTALGRQQWRVCQHLFYRSPSELAACTALVRTD